MTTPQPHHLPRRALCALLGVQLLLSACAASVEATEVDGRRVWPQPQQQPTAATIWPGPVQAMPNFQAPSALNCARPVTTREVPGRTASQQQGGLSSPPWWRERRADLADRAEAMPAPAAEAARDSRAAGGALARPSPAAAPLVAEAAKSAGAVWPAPTSPMPPPPPLQQAQPPSAVVTAGMVDDNADFSSYLQFRQRTRVQHRARDVSERYLLEVRDATGQLVPDAEVAVQSSRGAAMWARTDAGGRAWLHPNAFDPARSPFYDVAVRKDGRTARAVLQRGQKSAVEVVLDSRVTAQARARLDLVFLVDATGSMGDEIDKLKATLQTIAGEVARLPSQPDLCFGLVAYRDKGDEFLIRAHDLTNDVNGFQGVLNALQAAGGGDYPEAMNEALHDTVHKLSWRGDGATRLVVLLADAPPHLDYGGPQYDDDMMAALGKGIKVFSVGASGLDKQGEYIQRQIAQYTGGRFVFLTYDKAREPSSGPGRETVHDVRNYSVDTLDRLIVRLVTEELGKLPRG